MIVEIVHDQSPGKYEVGLGSNSQPLNQQLDSLLIVLQGWLFHGQVLKISTFFD